MTKRQWKRSIWKALHDTLDTDLDGLGAGYLFDGIAEGDKAEEKRMRPAAEEILAELARRADPPRHGPPRGRPRARRPLS